MKADENLGIGLFCDLDAAGQRDERIGIPGHDDVVAELIEVFFHKASGLQTDPLLLAKGFLASGPVILPSVARIDHDSRAGSGIDCAGNREFVVISKKRQETEKEKEYPHRAYS